jgi:hypothetical protein
MQIDSVVKFMGYIYVTDENIREYLISKNLKEIQSFNSTKKTWVFENNPSLFNICEENSDVKQKCFMSDKLTMFI